jgi:AcrR family transcriptional regulator
LTNSRLTPPPLSSTKRRSSRDALIAAALREFTERGYEAATVTSIAERAGVTTGALYAHFRGKLDLLLQALGIMPAPVLFQRLAELAGTPPPQVAHRLGEDLAIAPEDAALLLLDAIVAGRRDEEVATILRDGLVAYEDAMARATHAGAVLGLIDPALAPADLVRVLMVLVLGRLVVAVLGAPAPSPDGYGRLAELLLQSSGADGVDNASSVLERVRSRAQMLERARRDLAGAVAEAIDAGHSLRQVGDAAGLSHERVRQMVRTDVT